jgi:hypothetical protein
MNDQAKIHIAQIMQTQLRAGQGFDSVLKMTELVVTGIILVACKSPASDLKGAKPIEMLDHFRDNVVTLLKYLDMPEDVVEVAVENARRNNNG